MDSFDSSRINSRSSDIINILLNQILTGMQTYIKTKIRQKDRGIFLKWGSSSPLSVFLLQNAILGECHQLRRFQFFAPIAFFSHCQPGFGPGIIAKSDKTKEEGKDRKDQ